MPSTKNDTSRIANAGVETGAKMFGVWTAVTECPRARWQWQMPCRIQDEKRRSDRVAWEGRPTVVVGQSGRCRQRWRADPVDARQLTGSPTTANALQSASPPLSFF